MCFWLTILFVWSVLRTTDISGILKFISVSIFLTKMCIRVFPIPTMPKSSYNLILMMCCNPYFNSVTFALL